MSLQPHAAAAGFDADTLPVKLLFIAGETEVPFGELSGIGAGYIFDLQQAAHRHVEIRANGEPIGHGELVEIDGRVGVRILKCT